MVLVQFATLNYQRVNNVFWGQDAVSSGHAETPSFALTMGPHFWACHMIGCLKFETHPGEVKPRSIRGDVCSWESESEACNATTRLNLDQTLESTYTTISGGQQHSYILHFDLLAFRGRVARLRVWRSLKHRSSLQAAHWITPAMTRFLQKFFAEFTQYQSTNFYIFGESYAGRDFTRLEPSGPVPTWRCWSLMPSAVGISCPHHSWQDTMCPPLATAFGAATRRHQSHQSNQPMGKRFSGWILGWLGWWLPKLYQYIV